jgi:hypothetical protein
MKFNNDCDTIGCYYEYQIVFPQQVVDVQAARAQVKEHAQLLIDIHAIK